MHFSRLLFARRKGSVVLSIGGATNRIAVRQVANTMAKRNPIDAVLDAEKAAQAEIANKRDEAHRTVTQALSHARTISERTNERITKIHAHCAKTVKNQCDAMWQAYKQEPRPLLDKALTPERLVQVLESVATKLTQANREVDDD